ncbi:MAG: hypothetical protein J6B81_02350 [Spirochaetaceae bacterium]|nr:hypothetical protein [Spirochaetaceae bacterium]
MNKLAFFTSVLLVAFISLFFSCHKSNVAISVEKELLFSLEYGNFEENINLFSLSNPGQVLTDISMKDGFYYISNGESKKVLELNSYGDLLSLYYNADFNPKPSFASENQTTQNQTSTRKAIPYQFNEARIVASDSRKYLYVVDLLPIERQELEEETKTLLSQIVLRFDNNGNFVDYIGQQGPGGTPFPYIRNIHVSEDNELVVVCQTNTGITVYWFNEAGYLLYTIPFSITALPNPLQDQTDLETFVSLENIIPSYSDRTLFVKLDYYTTTIDTATNVQSGIDYTTTLLYPLNVETGVYGQPLTIPPYEDVVTDGFTKLVYPVSYDFLGVTNSGWLFFMVGDSTGYSILMIQADGYKIIKRHIDINHEDYLYHTFDLSAEGILSGLFAEDNKVNVYRWRTDSLVDVIIQG